MLVSPSFEQSQEFTSESSAGHNVQYKITGIVEIRYICDDSPCQLHFKSILLCVKLFILNPDMLFDEEHRYG